MSSKKSVGTLIPRARTRASLTRVRAQRNSLPPLFLSKKLRRSIELLLPAGHHLRLRSYFDNHGCFRCSRRAVIYGANGFCELCLRMIEKRLLKVDEQLQNRFSEPPPDLQEAYLRPYRSARQLLADLVPKMGERTTQKRPIPKHPSKVYFKWLT